MNANVPKWRLSGEEVVSCNCAWGCPCQFDALPTRGNCEGFGIWQVEEGQFGDTSMSGVKWAWLVYWPGPIHEGNGTLQLIMDEQSSTAQREALTALHTGTYGGAPFEIFSAVCPNRLDPIAAPIQFETDREKRVARAWIPGLAETRVEPIRNPVTGEEHRARIVLPEGFEYKEAEMGNTVSWKATAGGKLVFEHENTYAQLNRFDWTNS